MEGLLPPRYSLIFSLEVTTFNVIIFQLHYPAPIVKLNREERGTILFPRFFDEPFQIGPVERELFVPGQNGLALDEHAIGVHVILLPPAAGPFVLLGPETS